MIVVGIDQSFTGTGVAIFNGDNLVSRFQITSDPKTPMLVRQRFIESSILRALALVLKPAFINQVHVVSEGLAYGGVGKSKIDLAKLLGGIQTRLADVIPMQNIHEVSPTAWKKTFTGVGNCDKMRIIETVNKLFNLQLILKNNNIADAIGLAYHFIKTGKTINDNKVGIA